MERLKLKIPPVEDASAISDAHYALEAVEAIDIIAGVGGGDALMALVTAAGASEKLVVVMDGAGVAAEGFLAVAAPVAALVAELVALGLPYAEARQFIARTRLTSGIMVGVAMGADGREPGLVKDYFWEFGPEPDEDDNGVLAQNAYNLGLVTGYRQALELSQDQKATFWTEIGGLLGDNSWRGAQSDWDANAWKDWYITVGTTFSKQHMPMPVL